MHQIALGLALAALAFVGPLSSASIAIKFCSTALKDRRAAPGDAERNGVAGAGTKGIERGEVARAMKVLGQQVAPQGRRSKSTTEVDDRIAP
jgi:hypothetical protein